MFLKSRLLWSQQQGRTWGRQSVRGLAGDGKCFFGERSSAPGGFRQERGQALSEACALCRESAASLEGVQAANKPPVRLAQSGFLAGAEFQVVAHAVFRHQQSIVGWRVAGQCATDNRQAFALA